MRDRRLIHGVTVLTAALLVTLVAVLAVTRNTTPAPLEVVRTWTTARNAGDVERAMTLTPADADILGFATRSATRRGMLVESLRAQAVAGWRIEETECEATGGKVTCRYRQHDALLRRLGLSLTGVHEYVVLDGKIVSFTRRHDAESRDRVYAALLDFRDWVHETRPELVDVIWVIPTNALYSTVEGARAVLEIMDEYEPAAESS